MNRSVAGDRVKVDPRSTALKSELPVYMAWVRITTVAAAVVQMISADYIRLPSVTGAAALRADEHRFVVDGRRGR